MDRNPDRYIPTFSYGLLTPLHDLMMRWTTRESTLKHRLVELAKIEKGHRVLDLGCGTQLSPSSSRGPVQKPKLSASTATQEFSRLPDRKSRRQVWI